MEETYFVPSFSDFKGLSGKGFNFFLDSDGLWTVELSNPYRLVGRFDDQFVDRLLRAATIEDIAALLEANWSWTCKHQLHCWANGPFYQLASEWPEELEEEEGRDCYSCPKGELAVYDVWHHVVNRAFGIKGAEMVGEEVNRIMQIQGEICVSRGSFFAPRSDAWALIFEGVCREWWPYDVWSETDKYGMRYPTNAGQTNHDEGFLKPSSQRLAKVLVPRTWSHEEMAHLEGIIGVPVWYFDRYNGHEYGPNSRFHRVAGYINNLKNYTVKEQWEDWADKKW